MNLRKLLVAGSARPGAGCCCREISRQAQGAQDDLALLPAGRGDRRRPRMKFINQAGRLRHGAGRASGAGGAVISDADYRNHLHPVRKRGRSSSVRLAELLARYESGEDGAGRRHGRTGDEEPLSADRARPSDYPDAALRRPLLRRRRGRRSTSALAGLPEVSAAGGGAGAARLLGRGSGDGAAPGGREQPSPSTATSSPLRANGYLHVRRRDPSGRRRCSTLLLQRRRDRDVRSPTRRCVDAARAFLARARLRGDAR